jgi:DNA-binding NarL/FixJ family response regulator
MRLPLPISGTLGLSEHTVKNYIFRVFGKTGVSTRVELVLYARSHLQPLAVPGRVAS